jgi:hypothetical protein
MSGGLGQRWPIPNSWEKGEGEEIECIKAYLNNIVLLMLH